MFITSNPKDKIYRDLMDLAFDICDEFILVVRNDLYFNQNVDYLLEELKSSLKEVKDQYEWPGTFLAGGTPAKVYYYNTDYHSKKILKQVSSSLHDWVEPYLPEDLSFIKNHKPWLINTSHEYESYIETEDEEEIDKIIKIQGLKVRI